MRAERRADALVERERLAVGVEPARHRHGVLRQEADELAGRSLHPEVARPAVPELLGRDLDQLAPAARATQRAVARAGVDHEQLEVALGAHRGEHPLDKRPAVLDGDDNGDLCHGASAAGAHTGLGRPRSAA